jgi:hypothetical protein
MLVVTDPRTLQPVTKPAKCHLIPECFGVSNITIRMDGSLDNAIGRNCDCHLFNFFQLLVGEQLSGHFAFENGSKTVAGNLHPKTKGFSIPKPRRGTIADWAYHALGARNSQIQMKEFTSRPVILPNARMSMVNSAMLILRYCMRDEVYGPAFDSARRLLAVAAAGRLEDGHKGEIEEMTPIFGQISINRERLKGVSEIPIAEARNYYDPDWNPGDRLLEDFPKRCVSEEDGALIVRLPYGNCLRGVVRIPLQRTGA